MKRKTVEALLKEAKQLTRVLEERKVLYQRLDQLTLLLQNEDLSETGWAIIDNFAEKNVAFRIATVRRFELKRVKR